MKLPITENHVLFSIIHVAFIICFKHFLICFETYAIPYILETVSRAFQILSHFLQAFC